MDLAHVELLHLRVPLVRPFASARSTTATKDVLLVHLRTADGVEGWGECAAEVSPTYSPEHVDGAWMVLTDHLVPRLRRGESVDAIRGHHMAKAALEMAWLDVCGRCDGRSVAAMLGGRPGAALPVGVVVEMHDDPAEVARRAVAHVEQGYRRVKVKVAPGRDAVVRAVRDACAGGEVALWADANGSYAPDAGALVAALDVDLLEQPFAAGDLVDHAAFVGAVTRRPHVSLDESIDSVHAARAALALRAADSLVIKPGRLGGLAAAVAVYDHAQANGVPVWCGGMLETGVGRAANLAVASLPGFTLPGDLSASDRYFTRDVTAEPFVLGPGGTLRVPDGAGLGVEIDEPYVRSLAVRTAVL
jgi:O-succinylbenzoate synthase